MEGYLLYIQGNWTVNHLEVTNSGASAWSSYRRLQQLIGLSACELSPARAGLQHADVDGLQLEAVPAVLDSRASGSACRVLGRVPWRQRDATRRASGWLHSPQGLKLV